MHQDAQTSAQRQEHVFLKRSSPVRAVRVVVVRAGQLLAPRKKSGRRVKSPASELLRE